VKFGQKVYLERGSSFGCRTLFSIFYFLFSIFALMSTETNFATFWPEYVRAHSQPGTRAAHLAGTLAGWALLVAAVVLQRWWWIALALVVPYALAWISHFFVEHNRPATFEHPLWSWWADQKMVALMLTGKMGDEVRRCAPGN
jgi:hypothetical protein